MATKNLGLVRSVHVGINAPANTLMQWLDTSTPVPVRKDYDPVAGVWVPQVAGTAPTGPQFISSGSPEARIEIVGDALREFNNTNLVTLDWVVSKGNSPVTSIKINNTVIPVTSSNQSGTIVLNATQNVDTEFKLVVTTADEIVTAVVVFRWGYRHFLFASEIDLLGASDSTISSYLRSLPVGDALYSLVDLENTVKRSKVFRLTNPTYLYACYSESDLFDCTINNFSNNAFKKRTFNYQGNYGNVGMLLMRNSRPLQGTFILGTI